MADSPQLPESTEPTARVEASQDPDLISIREAVSLFRVDASTIRRRLRREEVEGARLVTGPKGEEWRFPAEALDALDYPRRSQPAAGEAPQAIASSGLETVLENTLEELREQLESMRQRLNLEQKQLETRTEEKARAEVEVGRLQERERALQEKLEERERQAEERYREALSLGWRDRRRRRKEIRSASEEQDG